MPTIYYLSPLDTAPSGGIKQLYRQVDILNRNGYSAAVVHRTPGFRHAWFRNETRIVYGPDLRLTAADILVMPEVFGHQAFARGIRKVVFNQNCYRTFVNYANGEDPSTIPYRDPEVVADRDDRAGDRQPQIRSRDHLLRVRDRQPVWRTHSFFQRARFCAAR